MQDNLTMVRGSHLMKAGIDIRREYVKSFFFPTIRGLLRYPTLNAFVNDIAEATNINKPLPGGVDINYYRWWDQVLLRAGRLADWLDTDAQPRRALRAAGQQRPGPDRPEPAHPPGEQCGNPSPTCPGERVGDTPRNLLRADGVGNVDVAITKNTRFANDQNIQIRIEMFNATNTRNFGIPDGRVSSANFLNQWATDGGARRVWVAVRYTCGDTNHSKGGFRIDL